MKLPSQMFSDRVKIIKHNGRTINNVAASVQRGKVLFPDTSVPIEDGDRVERMLPGNVIERYIVTDAGYVSGIAPIPEHYESVVRKEGDAASGGDRSPAPNTIYNVTGPQARINVQSTDVSTNVISVDATTLFTSMRDAVVQSDLDDDLRHTLTAHVNAMEAQSGSASFAKRYTEFMSVAADHLQLFGPFLPGLAQLLVKAAGG